MNWASVDSLQLYSTHVALIAAMSSQLLSCYSNDIIRKKSFEAGSKELLLSDHERRMREVRND